MKSGVRIFRVLFEEWERRCLQEVANRLIFAMEEFDNMVVFTQSCNNTTEEPCTGCNWRDDQIDVLTRERDALALQLRESRQPYHLPYTVKIEPAFGPSGEARVRCTFGKPPGAERDEEYGRGAFPIVCTDVCPAGFVDAMPEARDVSSCVAFCVEDPRQRSLSIEIHPHRPYPAMPENKNWRIEVKRGREAVFALFVDDLNVEFVAY